MADGIACELEADIRMDSHREHHQRRSARILPRDRAFDGGRKIKPLYPVHARRDQKSSLRTCKGYAQPSEPSQQSDQSVDVRHRNLPHVCGGVDGKTRFKIASDVPQELFAAGIGSGAHCHDRSRYPHQSQSEILQSLKTQAKNEKNNAQDASTKTRTCPRPAKKSEIFREIFRMLLR